MISSERFSGADAVSDFFFLFFFLFFLVFFYGNDDHHVTLLYLMNVRCVHAGIS